MKELNETGFKVHKTEGGSSRKAPILGEKEKQPGNLSCPLKEATSGLKRQVAFLDDRNE